MFRYHRQRYSQPRQPVFQTNCAPDLSTAVRAALILFSVEDSDSGSMLHSNIHVLLGRGAAGLTTLGGRTTPQENWLDCLVRELKEETRDILDYSSCKEIFLGPQSQVVNFDNCAYVFYQTTHAIMMDISRRFPKTSSPREVCNEMISLEVVPIDALVKDIIQWNTATQMSPSGSGSNEKTSKSRLYPCNIVFETMFLAVGYDILKGNMCNFVTANINAEADLCVPVVSLPATVCLSPIDHGLPVIYGFIKSRCLFITDQFYLEEPVVRDGVKIGRRRLFRSGWIDNFTDPETQST